MASVLVVDDDVDFAFIVAEVLRTARHLVRTAVDGRAGAREVLAERPDVVLCDVQMPFGGGPAFVAWLHARRDGSEHIPIILVSAGDDLEEIAAGLDVPNFLLKPFGIASLVALVARVLEETASLCREGKGSPPPLTLAPSRCR